MTDSIPSTLVLASCTVGLYVFIRLLASHGMSAIGLAPHRVMLPGPTALPLVGNLLELRKGHARALGKWAKKFGPMVRVVVGSREAVVLNTYNSVQKTLVSQGASFQGRPEFRLWHGIFALALDADAPPTLGTSPYSDRIPFYRKLLTAQTAVVRQKRYNHFAARRLFRLINLMAADAKKGPRDLGFYLWTTTSGFSADMLFGKRFDEEDTRVISETEVLIFLQRTIGEPLHDAIPLLAAGQALLRALSTPLRPLGLSKWIDELDATEVRAEKLRTTEVGYCKRHAADLHSRIKAGDTTPSQLGDLVRAFGEQLTPHDEYRITTSLVGSGMGVGTVVLWTISKLASMPEVQEKAYEAIREVYGDEYPEALDTDRVEYIKAIGLEGGRYFATARLGFPRETTEDCEVDGQAIPAGTLVVHNSYWVNRDPARFDRADEFIPERWMDGHYGRVDEKGDRVGVPHLNHGAGRRFCLGVPYVQKMLYGTIILLLHHFKFERAPLDKEGLKEVFPSFRGASEASNEMDPISDQESECAAQALPKAAGVRFVPRNPEALARWINEGQATLDQFDRPDESIKAAGEIEV